MAANFDNIAYFSMQMGKGEGDLLSFPFIHALGSKINTFEDSAAIIQNLDLLITVDTAIAHLAGALGKPVWVLLPKVADWRWMMEREDSPWYPSMRLFRQKESGDWAEVVERVKQELGRF